MSAEQTVEDPGKKNFSPAKSPTNKLTQEEIEVRILSRAKKIQEKVEALERSQIVTGEDMRLQFDGPGECGVGRNH
jgi:hypothetical protein